MYIPSKPTPKQKRISVMSPIRLDKDREEALRYYEYFDSVITEHAPKAIPKIEKALIDPMSPIEVKTGSVPKYGIRNLDDWSAFESVR